MTALDCELKPHVRHQLQTEQPTSLPRVCFMYFAVHQLDHKTALT